MSPQITWTSRRLRTAISTDGNTPTPQIADLSLEHWPRRSPPIQLQTSTQVPSGTTGARGFLQADGHEVLCWLDLDQHPFYLVAATWQHVLSAVPYIRINILLQYWPIPIGFHINPQPPVGL